MESSPADLVARLADLEQSVQRAQRAARRWRALAFALVAGLVLAGLAGWPNPSTRAAQTREAAEPESQKSEVVTDASGVFPAYSNFCRVTATPEEVIMDFGLNPQPFAPARQEVKITHRIVTTFFTAKRVQTALGRTIQKHEETFGPIELDARRRAAAAKPAQP